MGLLHYHKLSVPKAAVRQAGGEVVTATLSQAICPKGCSKAGRRGGGDCYTLTSYLSQRLQ